MIRRLDVGAVRRRFPALHREVGGKPAVFFDGPAGSQLPQAVIAAAGLYLERTNANVGGAFATSRESDALMTEARSAIADLVGTSEPDLIVFGPNMTTLTFRVAEALAHAWGPGDEIVVCRSEHDANYTPWVQAAERRGATVQRVGLRSDDATLDLDDLARKLGSDTRLLAVGCASNALGTVQPIERIVDMAHAAGALVYLDAVHYAPHRFMEVERWDCDFLVCSAYKFFGPHVGILYGKRRLLETLPVDKLRTVPDTTPERWMTGTQNHEGIAGSGAAVDYLAALGRETSDEPDMDRRSALASAYHAIGMHEGDLTLRLLRGLAAIADVRVWGITDPQRLEERVATVSLSHNQLTPEEVATRLGEQGIFVWHGNFYALPLTEAMGLEPHGLVRIGLLHYNTSGEVDRLLEALDGLGTARRI